MKHVERTTNHDVKAIEYVLKAKFAANEELAKVGRAVETLSFDVHHLRSSIACSAGVMKIGQLGTGYMGELTPTC